MRLIHTGGKSMNAFPKSKNRMNVMALSLALAFGVTSATVLAADVKLSGDQEVPAVKSAGAAAGAITIGDDGAVSGSVTATGFTPTAAHIHQAAAGKNGPVIVPFTNNRVNERVVVVKARTSSEIRWSGLATPVVESRR